MAKTATVQTSDGKCHSGTVQTPTVTQIISEALPFFGTGKVTTVEVNGKSYTGKEVGGKK